MKKYLFLILFSILILPKIAFAESTTSIYQVYDYGLSGGDNRIGTLLSNLAISSQEYFNDKLTAVNPYATNYIIYVKPLSTQTNYYPIRVYMMISDDDIGLQNCWKNNSNGNGLFFSGSDIEYSYYWDLYISKSNGFTYTDTALTNRFTSLSDNVNYHDTGLLLAPNNPTSSYSFEYNRINNPFQSYDINDNYIYSTNQSLNYCWRNTSLVQYDRSYQIISKSDNSVLGTYSVGDTIIGYYDRYWASPYLTGMKKISLTSGQYTLISGISSGKILIPYRDYDRFKPGVSYFNSSLEFQSYDSYINTAYLTPDGEYYVVPFNLSNYNSADAILFSKYVYKEGDTSFIYDIYIPDDSYSSSIIVSNNNIGSNDFTFNIYDNTGTATEHTISGPNLQQDNPFFNSLINSYGSDTFGISSIITAPLFLINQLTTSGCVDLVLPIPFLDNQTITLPCMYSFYSNVLGDFFEIYQMLSFGIIAYWVVVKIFNLIKDFKNPDHDEVEVMDL